MRAHDPRWVRLTFVSVLALTGASLTAQSGTAPTVDPMLQSLRWRNIGNANLIGRISSVDALEADWSHVVVGSASGGVWKSVNGGTSQQRAHFIYSRSSLVTSGMLDAMRARRGSGCSPNVVMDIT